MKKKVCVITGGGSGMGLASAKELGKEGSFLIDVASMSGHMVPAFLIPKRAIYVSD